MSGGSVSLLVATHTALVAVPVAFLFFVFDPSVLFLWHPTLMLIAFAFLMSEGVIFSRYIRTSNNNARAFWWRLHFYAQCAATVISVLGFLIILYNKHLQNHPHFHTWHSWLGLITLTATLGQGVVGLRMYYTPRITIRSLQILAGMRNFHRRWGTFTYLISFLTMASGLYSMGWHQDIWLGEFLLLICLGCFVGLAVYIVLFEPKKMIRRVDSLLDEEAGLTQSQEETSW
jgi:cytochrome b-561 domain-containing protein 2